LPKKPSAPITEQRNPASSAIDALGTSAILEAIHQQDASVPAAVRAEIPNIALAVEAVVEALHHGGRLFYVGAGTSGRLGVLDAAECPPTFGVSRNTVQAILAGGTRALTRAAEAAEDDAAQGRRDLARRRIGSRDVVIGLTASGRTPYTLGALRYARSRRAATVAITVNPGSPVARAARIAIVPETGPEFLAGSTRMKAALAQKMVLHMISTAAMIRLGRVYQNYMVGVRPTNRKLVARACSIIAAVTGASLAAASRALRGAGLDARVAIVMLRTGIDRAAASRLLARHGGNLRETLDGSPDC
jgi:N-acetylmuramic acid 6-phosphate etherase